MEVRLPKAGRTQEEEEDIRRKRILPNVIGRELPVENSW